MNHNPRWHSHQEAKLDFEPTAAFLRTASPTAQKLEAQVGSDPSSPATHHPHIVPALCQAESGTGWFGLWGRG